MIKYDTFIKKKDNKYKFNGYAYEKTDGYIILEINTIPFNKKIVLIKSMELFKVS